MSGVGKAGEPRLGRHGDPTLSTAGGWVSKVMPERGSAMDGVSDYARICQIGPGVPHAPRGERVPSGLSLSL